MQCRATRVVSMLVEPRELSACHMGHDPMDFLVHDLTHAHRMFGRGREHLAGQVGVLNLFSRSLETGCLGALLQTDKEFSDTFDYAIADMNTDCLHLLQYLKHALIAAQLRAHGLPATAQMPDKLNESFYDFFQHRFLSSWSEALSPSSLAALLRMCEKETDAIAQAVGMAELRALCVSVGARVLQAL